MRMGMATNKTEGEERTFRFEASRQSAKAMPRLFIIEIYVQFIEAISLFPRMNSRARLTAHKSQTQPVKT